MNKMFKKNAGFGKALIIITVVVIVTALTILAVLQPWKKEPIKIGAIISISGPASSAGAETRDGMLLAVHEINSWGGINGRKLALIIEDSESDPGEGREAFKRIEAAHHPLLYISMLSHVSMAVETLAEKNSVVLVGLSTSTPKFTEQKKWIFRYWPTAESDVPPLISILKKLKVKTLGMVYQSDEYGTSVFELLKKEFEKTGGVVRSKTFRQQDFNFKEQIEKLKGMEAIFVVGFPTPVRSALTQLRKHNFGGFVLSTNTAASPVIRSMPETHGVYLVVPIIHSPRFLFAREFSEKYEATYNKPISVYAANGYDFIKLLAGLLEDRELSRGSIKGLLEGGFIYSGVFGSLNVKQGEHNFAFPLHPAQVVDGKIKYLR